MIFLVVVIALGITHKQDKRYWVLAASASATQLLAHMLFNGCGSLENRGFDGYVSRVRLEHCETVGAECMGACRQALRP